MKTGKMRQLLALMLAGMLTVGYVGIPVFGVENNTAETAVETEAGTAIGALEEETISEKEEMIPSDAVSYKDHYYKLFALGGSYEDAEEYCLSLGGYLAVISDQEENDFLFSYMKSCGYENAYFGFSDQEDEGVWVWLGTEEKSSYTNWASKEPNSEDSMEDYAMFYWKYPDGKWNDGNFGNGTVSDDTAFLCEWKGTGLVSESEQDEKSFIELPNVALVSELKKLPVGETTEIPLTVRIRKDIDWSDFSIKDNTGEVLAYVSAEEITMDEDEFKIGNIAYDQVHINVGYKDNPSSNSTAVTLYAQMGEQKSNRVTLRRNLAVTKEMLQRYYAVLHDLNDFTEDFPVKILEDGTSVVTIKPEMLFNSVKEYLEGNSSVANVYSLGEDMLLYETVDGLMGYFQMTQVYEDEGENTAGGIGIPTDQTEYQVQSQYRYDNSFLYAPIDPDVLVLCPLDGSSITDRDGKKTQKIGKKLAKYNGGNCDIVTSKEETNILHILNSGALEDYGTIMFIAHGSPVSRGDGTSSVLFTIGSYDKQEKLNAQLDTWFSQHEGDDLYLRKLDYEDNYTEQISRSDLIPGIHMLAGLQYKYVLYDFFELIPIKQFNLCISTDYIMDVCGEIELPNTVFYIGACYSLKDSRFNHWVVQHHGVGVIGYDNKVQCLGEQEVCESLFKTLMEKDQKSEVATGYRNYTITDAALSVPGTFGLVMMDVSDVLGGADSQSMVAASEKLDYVYRGEGLLQGVIVDENDDPVEGADVHIARYLNGHFTRGQNSVTAADGTYHYDHLEFGQYMIYVQKKDVKAYAVLPHYKTNGKWPAIVLSMCSMTGTVLDAETNEPISGVTVTYEDKDDPSNTATTTADQEGQYTFENVPTGNYNLRFTHENYKDGKAELKVGADPRVYKVETVELEPEEDIDWYQYINDVLGPQYGYADTDIKKQPVNRDTVFSRGGWNNRRGIASAFIIDMTNDGNEDLVLYRFDTVPDDKEKYLLCAELYTQTNDGVIEKKGSINVSSGNYLTSISGMDFTSIRVGILYVENTPYIMSECIHNAYYWNGGTTTISLYCWDGNNLRVRWINGKTAGGTSGIIYSLRDYTSEDSYKEEVFAKEWLSNEKEAEAIKAGYKSIGLPSPENSTLENVFIFSNEKKSLSIPSYWDTDMIQKNLEILVSGHFTSEQEEKKGFSGEVEMVDLINDYTQMHSKLDLLQ